MKIITTKDKIISLEEVQSVNLTNTGTGAKSNPNKYTVAIRYIHGGLETVGFGEEKIKADKFMNEIAEILRAE